MGCQFKKIDTAAEPTTTATVEVTGDAGDVTTKEPEKTEATTDDKKDEQPVSSS